MIDQSVNGFIFPNSIIDELLCELSHSELKCYLVVLRKTKGWNKEEDYISVSQFMKVTGLSNRSVIDACESLVERGILERKTGERNTSIYSIKTYSPSTSEKSSPVKNFPSTSEKSSPVTSEKSSHTKNTIKNNITNTNLTVSKTRARKFDPESCDLPDYVDRDYWIAYCRMRKAKSSKTEIKTQGTVDACLRSLERFSGGDPKLAIEILERSTSNTWTGLFALDKKQIPQQPKKHNGFSQREYGETITPDWAKE